MNYLILLDHIVVSGSRFLLSILIARALGLADFGIYSLLWTIVTLASAMQIPVSITPMMQLGPRILPGRQSSFFASAMYTQLAYSAVAIPFISLATAVIVWGRADALAIVLTINLYIFVFNQYEYFRRYFFTKWYRFTAFSFDAALYAVLLSIIFGFLHFGGISIAGYLMLSSVPAVIFCLLTLRLYQFARAPKTIHFSQMKRMWLIASPLFVSTLAGFISGHVFVYSAALFLGTADVGGIAAARNIMGPLTVLMMALENSMTREAVLLHKTGHEQLMAFVRKTRVKWVFVFVAYAGTAALLAERLLVSSYGEEFGQFYELVYWMGLAAVPQVLSRIQAVKLRTVGNLRAIQRANIGAMCIACAVAPVATYFFGLSGTGFSIVIVASSITILQYLGDRISEKGNGRTLLSITISDKKEKATK